MRILIIRFSSMGDVILLTPLLSYLKEKNPAAEITVITDSPYAVLFGDDPRLTSVVPYVRSDEEKIFTKLALEKWDHVIDLQNNRRSRKLRKKYFPQVNFGVFDKLHVQRFLLLLVRLDFYNTSSNVARRYILAANNSLKSVEDIPPVKLYCDGDRVKNHHIFQQKKSGIIALFPFSAWKNKQWSMDSYAAIGRYFTQKDLCVAIFGGPEDVDKAETLKDQIGGKCFSFAGTLNLYEIGCYLTRCTIALGGDTGLSHLARACGVRTGIVYGATSRHFGFFPYGDPPFTTFESKLLCRPCHPHGGNICWRMSRPCLRMIKENDVIAGLEKLLENC